MFPLLYSPVAELLTPVVVSAAFTGTRLPWLVVEEVEEGWWWGSLVARASISAMRRFVLIWVAPFRKEEKRMKERESAIKE